MSFLGDARIIDESQRLFSKNFETQCVQEASYDLRLGQEYYLEGRLVPERLSDASPYLSLRPGQFAILTCLEELNLAPHIIGFISLRNRFKMQGLINISGFHVDPGFQGRLVFAVQNVGPSDIRLECGERTFSIFFADVEGRDWLRERLPKHREGIELADVQQLGGSAISLSKLREQVERLHFLMTYVYAPLAVGAAVALITYLLQRLK